MDLLKMQQLKYHCCINLKECKNDLTAEKYIPAIQTHRTDRAEQNKGMKSQPIHIKTSFPKLQKEYPQDMNCAHCITVDYDNIPIKYSIFTL